MKTLRIFVAILLLAAGLALRAGESVTIEQCVGMAEENYPLIKRYGLVQATKEIDLSDINRSWLPRIGVYGQATAQNVVPSFPQALTGVLHQMGQSVRGLDKLQYKVGVDVSQTVWDGGASSVRRDIVRRQEDVQTAALDVELYAVRERVENLYFAILLTEQQIARNEVTLSVLRSNQSRLVSMLRNGTAMQSDVDMVEAQILTLTQNIRLAQTAETGYRKALSLFVGRPMDDTELTRPDAGEPMMTESGRPELRLFDSRLGLNSLNRRMTAVTLRPKIGLFAQAYYGYPGFDYFKSMMNRNLTFNILAGVRVSWAIDSYYTRTNADRRTEINEGIIRNDREVFLFNTDVQTSTQRKKIAGLRAVMQDDSRIVELRTNVRKAAESQLANGVIDANALLTKISDENMAQLAAQLHEIQLIQEIYKLKSILNR